MNFESFYSDLISDERWFYLLRQYKNETIKRGAEKVYAQLVADRTVDIRPMTETRKHVYNTVCKNPGDRVVKDWSQIEFEKIQKKEEEEKAKEWVPLVGEARQKALAEFKAMVDKSAMINSVPRLTNKEIIESGQVRLPRSNGDYHRSVVEQMVIAKESKERIRECRRKFFLDAFPDATEEEIHAYWQQFPDTNDDAL